ncbi:hypothetical protein G4945_13505 [Anaerostipes hadrus]|uniref:hypothetical protein n=1 Tax=Anaerostipes hadrus TaxID=649756 RepID=UPI00156D68D3|nr:hypothetical protein [Anaerostipes hadrus]NSH12666.1 hypothetical protein [Anaerostipes hadrus]NSH21524.1 hypothetical protein [Anaerostipes hadrus]NSH35825.1 hypothetical protein [Anaerostipes hadrus]NSH56248.1 hypothetical protein [Anaerostipes hadrus]
MYYLRIYSSEKDGSIMLPFNNDLESLITYVVDQHERIIRYLESNNKKYEKIAFIWDKDRYDETLEVSIRNFDFGIFQSMNVQIFYDLTPEYDKEMHSEERIDRREVIHLEIMKKYPLKEKGIIDLMTRPEYYFVCAFTKEMALREGMDSHTARLRVGDIGVEYILSKKAEKRYGTIYKVKENKAIPNKHCIYDEIDFEDPDWEANLEIAMCKAFLQFYPLESTLKKENVDEVFRKIVGMRFNRISNIEYWILENLQVTKEDLPDFVIQESEINEEIRQGKTDVDYVLDGTFGEGVLNKQYPDFSVTYLMTNHNQMIITDARWN